MIYMIDQAHIVIDALELAEIRVSLLNSIESNSYEKGCGSRLLIPTSKSSWYFLKNPAPAMKPNTLHTDFYRQISHSLRSFDNLLQPFGRILSNNLSAYSNISIYYPTYQGDAIDGQM